MLDLKRFRTYLRIIGVAGVVILLLLSLFISSPLIAYTSGALILNQIGLQRTRVELITKDVLILAQRTSASERAQALSELQTAIPSWERSQKALRSGDRELFIPAAPTGDIALLITSANSDYVQILAAAKAILAHNDAVDSDQVTIILAHEPAYLRAMTQITTLYQQHIDGRYALLFWMELGIATGLLLLAIGAMILIERSLAKVIRAPSAKSVTAGGEDT